LAAARKAADAYDTTARRVVDIPTYQAHKIQRRIWRYQFFDPVTGYVTNPKDLCLSGAFGVPQLIGGTNLYPLIGAFRVVRVEMWAPVVQSLGFAETCSITLNRTLTNATSSYLTPQVVDTTVNPNVPAHVMMNASSPGAAILKQWFDYGDSAGLFQISGPKGTQLEIELEYMLNLQPGLSAGAGSAVSVSFPTLGVSAFDLQNASGSRVIRPIVGPGFVIWD